MLSEQPSKQCTKCYEQEEHGWTSMRNSGNIHFGHHVDKIKETTADGHYDDVNMIYWDIRFSNLCNLSCRSCGSMFSSNWYDDQVALWGKPDHAQRLPMQAQPKWMLMISWWTVFACCRTSIFCRRRAFDHGRAL